MMVRNFAMTSWLLDRSYSPVWEGPLIVVSLLLAPVSGAQLFGLPSPSSSSALRFCLIPSGTNVLLTPTSALSGFLIFGLALGMSSAVDACPNPLDTQGFVD